MTSTAEARTSGVHHRTLGDLTATALDDGYLDAPLGIMRNVTPEEAQRLLTENGQPAQPRISVNAFLIRKGDEVILIETGSGNTMGPTLGRMRTNIERMGINPAAIKTVLLTHLHPDHSNGLTGDDGSLLFPDAEIVVHEAEVAHWFDDVAMGKANERQRERYFLGARRQIGPYRSRLRTFTGGEVASGIAAVPIPGHTPGHTAYLINSGAESLLIWGDTVHIPDIQIPMPDVTMEFDTDPQMAARMRRRVFDMAAADRLLVGGMHLHYPGFGRMERHRDGYRYVPE